MTLEHSALSQADGWLPGPVSPVLVDGQVHVWRIDQAVGEDEGRRTELYGVLDDRERARADRFKSPIHRGRFILRHAAARGILARYLGSKAEAIRYTVDPNGKPRVAGGRGEPVVHFNLSDSHDLALLAVAGDHAVGVDIEYLRPGRASRALAERFFAAGEVEALAKVPDACFADAFFACWTRKEAFVKGVGVGITSTLKRFEVSTNPGADETLVRAPADLSEGLKWWLQNIDPGAGYTAAVALARGSCRIARYRYEPDGV